MKAVRIWLAWSLLLLHTGCGTPAPWSAPHAEPLPLGQQDQRLAQALAHFSQGLIEDESGQNPEAALRELDQAAKLDPENLALRLQLAAGSLARGDAAGALVILEEARRDHPDIPHTYLLLGMTYQVVGKYDRAEVAYRQMVRLVPTLPDGYIRLGTLLCGEDRFPEALRVLRRGVNTVPNPADLVRFADNLGRLYLLNNKPKEALQSLLIVEQKEPRSMASKEALAQAWLENGEPAKAVAALEFVIEHKADGWQTHQLLGSIYEEQGKTDRAAAEYGRAIALDPKVPSPYLRLALLQASANPDQAIATVQRAVAAAPLNPEAHTSAALAYVWLKRYPDALAAFARAEQIADAKKAGLSAGFYFWYGSACERAGEFEQAERRIGKSISLDPTDPEPLNYLAYMWAEKGVKFDKALEYATRALELKPDEPAYLDTLGWIYYQRGDYRKAYSQLLKAWKLMPEDATITDHVGDVSFKLGRTRQALAKWSLSLHLDPTSEAVAAKLRAQGVDPDAIRRQAKAPAAPAPGRD